MQRITGVGEATRSPEDFYTTPTSAVEELLKRETFKRDGEIWECASGDGAISKILEARGFKVRSSDIREDDAVYGEKGVNFLLEPYACESIITNPPFKSAMNFILHSLECANKVAIFGRIQLLEGKERYIEVFSRFPPKRVYIFSSRCACGKDGVPQPAIMCFAWFVWEKGFNGKPELNWIA